MKVLRSIGLRLGFLLFLISIGHYAANAQKTDTPPKEVTIDEFPRSRDITRDLTKGASVFVFKRPKYKLKRITKAVKPVAAKKRPALPSEKPVYKLPADTKSAEVWKRIGVTIWRLATDKGGNSADRNAAVITLEESATGQQYKPIRVSAETVFALGDKVRLSFESPNDGYLYVIDREVYADGTVGEPILIFPTMLARGGNNFMQAGQMIDIPAQSDRVPYFTLESRNKNWRGELLTVIVSPEPLKEVEIPDGPSPISAALVEALEARYLKNVAEYEQQGSLGKPYTNAEKEAGSSLTRELTQKDPFPQTMFRVKMRQMEPMLVNFGLKVK